MKKSLMYLQISWNIVRYYKRTKEIKGVMIMENKIRNNRGITLIALVVTTIFSYDENVKSSNNKGFLL